MKATTTKDKLNQIISIQKRNLELLNKLEQIYLRTNQVEVIDEELNYRSGKE